MGQADVNCFTYHSCSSQVTTFDDKVSLHGKLTSNCLVLTSDRMHSDDSWNYHLQDHQRTEAQVGLISRW